MQKASKLVMSVLFWKSSHKANLFKKADFKYLDTGNFYYVLEEHYSLASFWLYRRDLV